MLRIDNTLLEEIGLADLPLEEKDLLIAQIHEQLEIRVGTRLADAMSDEQMTEFNNKYIETNDQAGAMRWLQENFPNYPKVVEEELSGLKAEMKSQSQAIRDIVQQQASSASENAPASD